MVIPNTEITSTAADAEQGSSSPSADATPAAPTLLDTANARIVELEAKAENDKRSQEGRVSAARARDAKLAALEVGQGASLKRDQAIAEAQASQDFSDLPATLKRINAEAETSAVQASTEGETADMLAEINGLIGEHNLSDTDIAEAQRVWSNAKSLDEQRRARNMIKDTVSSQREREAITRADASDKALSDYKAQQRQDTDAFNIGDSGMSNSGGGDAPFDLDTWRAMSPNDRLANVGKLKDALNGKR